LREGEVAGLLGGARAGPVGSVADEEGRVEDLEQEGGDGQVKILRGKARRRRVGGGGQCVRGADLVGWDAGGIDRGADQGVDGLVDHVSRS
jgi:hypothetical protein